MADGRHRPLTVDTEVVQRQLVDKIRDSDTYSLPTCLAAYCVEFHRLKMAIIILHDHVEKVYQDSQGEASGTNGGRQKLKAEAEDQKMKDCLGV